jgi:cell wall-associated NlpC family hydrolase
MTTNADIVTAARSWIGTRFHHQGRLKKTAAHKGGVDCLGLLAGVAAELDLRMPDRTPLIAFDRTDYTHFPDTAYLRKQLKRLLYPIPVEGIVPGHILLLNIEQNPQHMAVVSGIGGGLGLIHAYAPARAVVEHALDDAWHRRIETAYRFF